MLRIGRENRVGAASLLRVLERGEPECNGAHDGRFNPPTQKPRRAASAGLLVERRSHTPITDCVDSPRPQCSDLALRAHLGLAGRSRTVFTTCARWDRMTRSGWPGGHRSAATAGGLLPCASSVRAPACRAVLASAFPRPEARAVAAGADRCMLPGGHPGQEFRLSVPSIHQGTRRRPVQATAPRNLASSTAGSRLPGGIVALPAPRHRSYPPQSTRLPTPLRGLQMNPSRYNHGPNGVLHAWSRPPPSTRHRRACSSSSPAAGRAPRTSSTAAPSPRKRPVRAGARSHRAGRRARLRPDRPPSRPSTRNGSSIADSVLAMVAGALASPHGMAGPATRQAAPAPVPGRAGHAGSLSPRQRRLRRRRRTHRPQLRTPPALPLPGRQPDAAETIMSTSLSATSDLPCARARSAIGARGRIREQRLKGGVRRRRRPARQLRLQQAHRPSDASQLWAAITDAYVPKPRLGSPSPLPPLVGHQPAHVLPHTRLDHRTAGDPSWQRMMTLHPTLNSPARGTDHRTSKPWLTVSGAA
ncbi:hypothetical protein SRB17_52400 [Streptomyces sp. RB17]|nr:hypothetical protein [Streptomyces sp. RB17]